MKKRSGFIVRGWLAIILLIISIIGVLTALVTGDTSNIETWLVFIAGFIILTIVPAIFRSLSKKQ